MLRVKDPKKQILRVKGQVEPLTRFVNSTVGTSISTEIMVPYSEYSYSVILNRPQNDIGNYLGPFCRRIPKGTVDGRNPA